MTPSRWQYSRERYDEIIACDIQGVTVQGFVRTESDNTRCHELKTIIQGIKRPIING